LEQNSLIIIFAHTKEAKTLQFLKIDGKDPKKKKIFLMCFFLNISTFTVPDQMPARP